MKIMNVLLATAMLAGSAFAEDDLNLLQMSTAATSTPTAIVLTSVQCTVESPEDDLSAAFCQSSQIIGAGLLTSSTILILLKEEIKQVEPDAYNFLAGEQMTLALEETIEKLRSESEELDKLSDSEIAMVMVQSL